MFSRKREIDALREVSDSWKSAALAYSKRADQEFVACMEARKAANALYAAACEGIAEHGINPPPMEPTAILAAIKSIKPVSKDACAGTDAPPARFGQKDNGADPAPDAAVGSTGAAAVARTSVMDARVEESTAHAAPLSRTPSYDPDGFYSHGDHTPEAFGALPCRTVANAVCDAPPTAASSADHTLSPPPDGGVDGEAPSPLAVHLQRSPHDAGERNIRGLSFQQSYDSITEAAL